MSTTALNALYAGALQAVIRLCQGGGDEATGQRLQRRLEVVGVVAVARLLDFRAGKIKLRHEGILRDNRRLALLLGAHGLHLLVGVVGVLVGARAAGAIGDRHAAEPFLRLLVAGEDAVQRHHLEVVLVCANAEVGRPAKRLTWLGVVGDEQVGARVGKLDHGRNGERGLGTPLGQVNPLGQVSSSAWPQGAKSFSVRLLRRTALHY